MKNTVEMQKLEENDLILGHGVDIVDLKTMAAFQNDDGWLKRCFNNEELQKIPVGPTRSAHIAGRFAAKEAVLKALGCGFGDGVALTDIGISRADGAPPDVALTGGAAACANRIGITKLSLSISHSQTVAIASVIATSDA
ncbi:holo-ACP synthase [Ponticaulis koreensis]|uniref:holo-ACP synthase n=1 Tax=Ponticaulis koreensis TaxID=1123045 RepID=UPI001F18026E|nr:holo-ACP synthase [Ponticaulis koreensis]